MLDTETRETLQRSYLHAFDSFAIVPSDLVDAEIAHNTRHARELLGVLESNRLVVIQDVNGEGDVWQVANPGTYDTHTREEAESTFDAWVSGFENTTPATPDSATPTKRSKTVTNPADLPTCLCGCSQPVTNRKSQYRPGHDARHAGQVGRALIEATTAKQRDSLLKSLGSDALRAKAQGMLDRHVQKSSTVKMSTIVRKVSKEFVAAKKAEAKPAPVKATPRKRGVARKAIPTKVAQATA